MQLDPGLLAAIIERPDDDLPRLIAADWWQERGEEERAEFVRIQCDIARANPALIDIGDDGHLPLPIQKYHDRLRRRERELLSGHACEWFEAMQWHEDWGGIGNVHDMRRGTRYHGGWFNSDRYIEGDFSRGFVETIICSWSDWTRHADAIRAATPLRRVNLTDFPPFTHTRDSRTRRIVESDVLQQYPGIEFYTPPVTSGFVTADIGQITSAVPHIER